MSTFVRENIPSVIVAIVAVLAQLILAPYICIGYGMPNFILCYVLARSLLHPEKPGYICAFIMGIIYDLASSAPVGAMACVLVVISFVITLIYRFFDSNALSMSLLLIVFGCFVSEFLYAILMIACGTDVSLLDALIYRVLPCGLYDTVITALVFFIWHHFDGASPKRTEMNFIR